jgi:hypothetical protein
LKGMHPHLPSAARRHQRVARLGAACGDLVVREPRLPPHHTLRRGHRHRQRAGRLVLAAEVVRHQRLPFSDATVAHRNVRGYEKMALE